MKKDFDTKVGLAHDDFPDLLEDWNLKRSFGCGLTDCHDGDPIFDPRGDAQA